MYPGMRKTSSLYCRFEDVQLEDDDLETQVVAGVSADLSSLPIVESRYALNLYLHWLSIQSS